MLDADTLHQAQGTASYTVDHLYRPDGSVSPHYGDEPCRRGMNWDDLMEDERFAEIIANELRAEERAGRPLDHLSRYVPEGEARGLFAAWLAFINVDLDPWTTGGAIHFRAHWARVLALALNLGVHEGLGTADLSCLAAAAAFHDSRRKNPYLDTGHGARAAEYYAQFCRETPQGSRRDTRIGRAMRFDPRTYLIVKWHDRDDEQGIDAIDAAFGRGGAFGQDAAPKRDNSSPSATDGPGDTALPQGAQADPVLLYRLFKDADGLDRVRLGENEPDVSYLRTSHAVELLDLAREMVQAG